MTQKYTLKVFKSFSAAHQLRNYVGKCARLHGHDYRVEMEVSASELNNTGLAVDSGDMKKALNSVIDTLDHRNLNDLVPFDTINPTAENIAAWLFDEIAKIINTNTVQLTAITLWETANFSVRYEKP